MSFLTEWVTNIILFILLAIVIDLLLPSSAMQKYAKMVISLLLIVVILSPILKIFSMDMDKILLEVQANSPTNNEENIKNQIEKQKNEIQANERAYILEEVAVQLQKVAEEELMESYDVMIEDIQVSANEKIDMIEPEKYITAITIHLKQAEPRNSSDAVETVKAIDTVDVEIGTNLNQPQENELNHIKTEMTTYLAKTWQISPDIISVVMEGGDEKSDGE
jgi:stage III sporulation protein AF